MNHEDTKHTKSQSGFVRFRDLRDFVVEG